MTHIVVVPDQNNESNFDKEVKRIRKDKQHKFSLPNTTISVAKRNRKIVPMR